MESEKKHLTEEEWKKELEKRKSLQQTCGHPKVFQYNHGYYTVCEICGKEL